MPAPDYDRVWAEVYGDMQRYGPVHRHLTRMVRGLLAPLDYRTVLDVGCGPGHNHELLCQGRPVERFAGVDVSPAAIDAAARAVPSGQFAVLDIQAKGPAGTWDLVYCALTLEHLADDQAALANLRPAVGRYLVVSTISGDYERYRTWEDRVGHVRNYAVGELEAKLAGAGFRVARATYWGFPFYSPVARTLQRRRAIGTGRFGPLDRALAEISFAIFYLNSSRRGDVLLVLAEPT